MATSENLSVSDWIVNLSNFEQDLYLNYDLNNSLLFHTSLSESAVDTYQKVVRQFRFWNTKLSKEVNNETLIFAVLGPKGFNFINIIEIIEDLLKFVPENSFRKLYYTENTSFIGIKFHSSEFKKIILERFLQYKGNYIAYVGEGPAKDLSFRIHWIPPDFELNKVKSQLLKFVDFIKLQEETTKINEKLTIQNNILSGTFKLKPGIGIDSLPHIFKIDSFRYALLIIKNREPICLKCKKLGHIRKDCQSIKCSNCQSFHLTMDKCIKKSYSNIVENLNITDPDQFPNFQSSEVISQDIQKEIIVSNKINLQNMSLENSVLEKTNLQSIDDSVSLIEEDSIENKMDYNLFLENKRPLKHDSESEGESDASSEISINTETKNMDKSKFKKSKSTPKTNNQSQKQPKKNSRDEKKRLIASKSNTNRKTDNYNQVKGLSHGALYGVLFSKHQEAAFSNFRLWESIGFIIAFAYANFLCIYIKIYILLGVLLLGMIGYGGIELIERNRAIHARPIKILHHLGHSHR